MSTEHGAGAAWSPAGSMALASRQPLRSITQSHSVYHTHRLGPAPGGAEGRACGEVGEAQGREREFFKQFYRHNYVREFAAPRYRQELPGWSLAELSGRTQHPGDAVFKSIHNFYILPYVGGYLIKSILSNTI